jgi:hypothetical protein
MRVRALAVVGQHLDHAALAHLAVPAAGHHQRQLLPQCHQAADARVHIGQACLRNRIGGLAGLAGIVLQGEQRADRIDLEAELPGVPNEGQPPQLPLGIVPPVPLAAGRWA